MSSSFVRTVAVFVILLAAMTFDRASAGPAASVDAKIAALEAEIAAKQAELRRLRKQADGPSAKPGTQNAALTASASANDFERYYKLYLREQGYQAEVKPEQPPAKVDPCDPQRLFIRADSLDNYLYGVTPASKAKGASLSWTEDREADVTTTKISGMVSYVLLRSLCPTTPVGTAPFVSGYAVAPFVYGNGALTSPQSKKEQSVLKTGAEVQLEVSRTPFIKRHVFTLAPYYLTDFRSEAQATGLEAYWDLYDAGVHLGGYIATDPNLGWFVQLRGIVDMRRVDDGEAFRGGIDGSGEPAGPAPTTATS